MQGLPFDETDFPPASTATTWEQASTRPQQHLDDELYRFVAAPDTAQQDEIVPYSQQIPQAQQRRDVYRLQHPVNRLPRRQQRPQDTPHSVPLRILHHHHHQQQQQPPPPPPQQQQQQNTHASQPQALAAPVHAQGGAAGAGPAGGARQPLSGATTHGKGTRRTRSAVEEARMRAQREAETFANSRRDPKREQSLQPDDKGPRGSKRARTEAEPNSSNEYHPRRGSAEDDSETEKKERYKRRLDMNRESAAVSRVRRRAYVKELEERLAGVEAEKLQLEGKLEIMMSQNEGLKKQLDNLFIMVAGGRRPVYPAHSQGMSAQPPGDG